MKRQRRIGAMLLVVILMFTGVFGSEMTGAVLQAEAAEIYEVDNADALVKLLSAGRDMEFKLSADLDFSQLGAGLDDEIKSNVKIDLNGYGCYQLPEGFFAVADSGTLEFTNSVTDGESILSAGSNVTGAVITVSQNARTVIPENVGLTAEFKIMAENGGTVSIGETQYVSTAEESIVTLGKEAFFTLAAVSGKTKATFSCVKDAVKEETEEFQLDRYFLEYKLGKIKADYLEFDETSFTDSVKTLYIAENISPALLEKVLVSKQLENSVTVLNDSSTEVETPDGNTPDNLYVGLHVKEGIFGMKTVSTFSRDGMTFLKPGEILEIYSMDDMGIYDVKCGNGNRKTLIAQDTILPNPDGTHSIPIPSYAIDFINVQTVQKQDAIEGTDYEIEYADGSELTGNQKFYSAPLVIRPMQKGWKIATPGAIEWQEELVLNREGSSVEQQFVLVNMNITDSNGNDNANHYGMTYAGNTKYNMNFPPVITKVKDSTGGNAVTGSAVITVEAEDTYSPSGLQYSFDAGKTWGSSNTKTYTETTIIPANTILVRDGQSESDGTTVGYAEPITLTIDNDAPEIILEGEILTENENGNTYNSTVNISFKDASEKAEGSLYEGFVSDTAGSIPVKTGETLKVFQEAEQKEYTVVAKDALGNESRRFFALEKYSHELKATYGAVSVFAYKAPLQITLELENMGKDAITVSAADISSKTEAFAAVEQKGSWKIEAGASVNLTFTVTESLLPGNYEFDLQCTYSNAEGVRKAYTQSCSFDVKKADGKADLNCDSIHLGEDAAAYIKSCITTNDYDLQNAQIYYKTNGASEENYTLQQPASDGTYDLKVILAENEKYNRTVIYGTLKILLREVKEDMYEIQGTEGKNGWYTSDVTILPKGDYRFNGENSSYTLSESGSVTFSILLPDETRTKEFTFSAKIDKTAPAVGENEGIRIEDSFWKKFLEVITFGIYKGEIANGTVLAHDDESELNYGYYVSDHKLTLEEAEQCNYKEGSRFTLLEEGPCIVYARVENEAGLCTYLSSDGMIFDMTKPVISGVKDGESYNTKMVVRITDDNLDMVTLNGEIQVITDGAAELVFEPDVSAREYQIRAVDRVGLESSCKFIIEAVSETTANAEPQEKNEPEESAVPEKNAEPSEDIEPENTEATSPEEKTVISGGRIKMEKGKSYWLDSGSWEIAGDKTVYTGGQSIRAMESGEYEFRKME